APRTSIFFHRNQSSEDRSLSSTRTAISGFWQVQLARQQVADPLGPNITYRFPDIDRKMARRFRGRRRAGIDVPGQSFDQGRLTVHRKCRSMGLRPAVKGLANALHLLWHRQVADTHLSQIVVHVLAEMVK